MAVATTASFFIGCSDFFLVMTVIFSIIDRAEEPLWKSFVLPFLYASPGSQLDALGGRASEMTEAAKSTSVQTDTDKLFLEAKETL